MNLVKKLLLISLAVVLVGAPAFGQAFETEANAVAGDSVAHNPNAPIAEAAEAVLFDNGPLLTSVGTGVGGADESVLQSTSLGMNTLGFGHQVDFMNHIADDFTLAEESEITDITFYAYQSFAPSAPSTIHTVVIDIWDGQPGAGGMVIFSETCTPTSAWSGIYRVTETTTGVSADRAIFTSTCTLAAPQTMAAGTYWMSWQSDGSDSFSGPWAPPVTIAGQASTGNALQSVDDGVTWPDALDSGTGTPQQGFPFIIEGNVTAVSVIEIPTASTWGLAGLALLLVALAMVALRRRTA